MKSEDLSQLLALYHDRVRTAHSTIELPSFPADEIQSRRREWINRREKDRKRRFRSFIASEADLEVREAVYRGAEQGASAWLSVVPIRKHDLCLDRQEWADAMALRFGQTPHNLPVRCGCGKPGEAAHFLHCPLGGFPHARHNVLRDFLLDMCVAVFARVRREPRLESLSQEQKVELAARYRTAAITENP